MKIMQAASYMTRRIWGLIWVAVCRSHAHENNQSGMLHDMQGLGLDLGSGVHVHGHHSQLP